MAELKLRIYPKKEAIKKMLEEALASYEKHNSHVEAFEHRVILGLVNSHEPPEVCVEFTL